MDLSNGPHPKEPRLEDPQPILLVQPANNAEALAEQMEKGYKYSRVYIDFLPVGTA